MRHIAYRRFSPSLAEPNQQLTGLDACDIAFEDHCAGNAKQRPGLEKLMRFISYGDVVHTESIDLLARDARQLLEIINFLQANAVSLVLHLEGISFSANLSDQERSMLKLLESLIAAEDALNQERQRSGIRKAQAKGIAFGRPQVDKRPILALIAQGIPGPEIAQRLGCSVRTVQRIAREDTGH